jgi:hypothetical protein
MTGALGYLRGVTKCLLCGGEHEPTLVSFGVYGSIGICPGHQVGPKRVRKGRIRFAGETRIIAHEIIGRARGK